MKAGWILLLFLVAPVASAQAPATPMLKCADGRGNVTYSNVPCDKQGLKEVGQVADRTTVMPLGPMPKPPAAAPSPAAATKDAPRKDDPENLRPRSPAQVTPAVPLLEKLSK